MKASVDTVSQSLDEVRNYWEWYMERTQVPGQEFGSKGYFDSIRVDHERAYGYANELLDLSRLRGRSLLELGCGIGLDTVEFARHGAEVTAVDASPMALDLARKNLEQSGLQARLEYGNAEGLDFEADSFDFVVARGILMFTPDDLRIVDEIHRVLTPGGEAQALLHKRLSWYVLLARATGTNLVHEDGDPPINRLYSEADVRRMFDRFSSHQTSYGRFPYATRRTGLFAQAFNRIFVLSTRALPSALLHSLGYYLIVKVVK